MNTLFTLNPMKPISETPGFTKPTLNLMLFGVITGALALLAAYSSTKWYPLRGPDGGPVSPVLQHTLTTAWAAMLITMPAFCAFWFRQKSYAANRWWLTFWSIGFAVFLVHFVQAVFVFFGNDWSKILNSNLVTIPVLGTFVTVWWMVDVGIAWWNAAEGRLVRIQRMALTVILLLLFLLGSLKEGGYTASFVSGAILGLPVLVAIILKLSRFR